MAACAWSVGVPHVQRQLWWLPMQACKAACLFLSAQRRPGAALAQGHVVAQGGPGGQLLR